MTIGTRSQERHMRSQTATTRVTWSQTSSFDESVPWDNKVKTRKMTERDARVEDMTLGFRDSCACANEETQIML